MLEQPTLCVLGCCRVVSLPSAGEDLRGSEKLDSLSMFRGVGGGIFQTTKQIDCVYRVVEERCVNLIAASKTTM